MQLIPRGSAHHP